MPNSKQARKRMLTDERRRLANKALRTRMRSAIKTVKQAESPKSARAALAEAMKRVDKCAKKNVIHANAAARIKRQLSRAVYNS